MTPERRAKLKLEAAEKKTVTPAEQARKVPQVVSTEQVQAACGHTVEFGMFADKADKFREARRDKLTNRPCKECRSAIEKAKQDAAAPRRAEKRAAKTAAWKEKRWNLPHRLPDGAAFEAHYNADLEQWQGRLTIQGKTFVAVNSAVFKLLRCLDYMYRDSLIPQLAVAGDQ